MGGVLAGNCLDRIPGAAPRGLPPAGAVKSGVSGPHGGRGATDGRAVHVGQGQGGGGSPGPEDD